MLQELMEQSNLLAQLNGKNGASDGSWYGEIEMPAGTYASVLNKLGDVTKGSGEAKIIS